MNALLQLILFVTVLTSTKPFDVQETNDKIFRVYFEQEHKQIEARGDDVFLKKEPFDIVLELPEPMEVLVHASLNPETFDAAAEGKAMKKLPGFANPGMTEGLFNSDTDVMLSHGAPSFWFYRDDTQHSFTEAEEEPDFIQCKRRVVQLKDIDSNRVIKIQDVTKPLNLVFISYERAEGAKESTELNRVAVRVNWDD